MTRMKAYHTHWKTRDGSMLLPHEMETGHIVDALNMLMRLARAVIHHELKALELSALAYAGTAPDGAAMAAEHAATDAGEEWLRLRQNLQDPQALRLWVLKTFPVTAEMERVVIARGQAGLPDRGLFKGVK